MLRKTDVRYIFVVGAEAGSPRTCVGTWMRNSFEVVEDPRTPDKAMSDAVDAGWEGRFWGLSGGLKTEAEIWKKFGHDWEGHSIVVRYEDDGR
jgi:hypothetical protein